jgi:hypothetical protein
MTATRRGHLPIALAVLAVAAAAAIRLDAPTVVCVPLAVWVVLLGPGAGVVALLRPRGPLAHLLLALAVSLAAALLVGLGMLLAHAWAPDVGFLVIANLTVVAAAVQAVAARRTSFGVSDGTAVIRWGMAPDGGRFYAVAHPVDYPEDVIVGQSPVLESPPRSRDAVLEMARAVEDLEWTLVAAGWRADGVGKHWYERRFTWTPAVGAPHLGRREPAPGPAHVSAALLDAVKELPAREPPQVLLTNARVRLLLAVVSLGSLLLGTIGLAVGANGLRAVCMVFFGLVGIGSAPWQGNAELRLSARLTLTFVTGFAVLALDSMSMLAAHSWHPLAAFAVVALICAVLHVLGLWSALKDVRLLRVARWPAVRVRPATLTLACGGAALCLLAAFAHRHLVPGFDGFLVQIGPVWYVGLALILISLVTAHGDEEQELALPVLAFVLVMTLTPALVYDGPRSQSAGKHIDLVQQIQTYHALVSPLDIYNNWSGFFASIAWLCDIAGIRDPTPLATFWPALIAVFRVAALRFLFGQLLSTPRQCWIAVALAVLADSIGADYFSPQSVGFLLGLAIFGLALAPYRRSTRLSLILIAGCVLAMSHQLSPYVVGGVLIILVLFKQVRPWWTPVLVLGPALVWAGVHAGALKGFVSLKAIGFTQNFHAPPTPGSHGLARLPIVRETVLAVLFSIAVLGVLALIGLVKNRRGRRYWAWALCPSAGVALVIINPYGQEGIFRAALFGLPWLAVLGASWLSSPPRLVTRAAALAVVVALVAANLVSSFGLDAINVIRPGDLAAYRFFQRQDGPRPAVMHYLLPLGTGDLPRGLPPTTGGHDPLSRTSITFSVNAGNRLRPKVEMQRITQKFLNYSAEPERTAKLYALWSPVQSLHDWAYAVRLPARSAALRDAFIHAPYWDVAFHENGTLVFRFNPARYPRELR